MTTLDLIDHAMRRVEAACATARQEPNAMTSRYATRPTQRQLDAHRDVADEIKALLAKVRRRSDDLLPDWQERHVDTFADHVSALEILLEDADF